MAKAPGWLIRAVDFLIRHRREIEYGALVIVVVLALVLACFLVRHLRRREAAPPASEPVRTPWQPSAQQARLLLDDADALAAQNRFAEAVHLLLLVSIQEIADRRPGLVAPALTSREIASLPSLSPLAQKIFFAIALIVEKSRFGNRPLAADEYAQCRAAFAQFVQTDAWRDAA